MSRMILEMDKKPTGVEIFRKRGPKNRQLWLYGFSGLMSFTIFIVFWCTNIFRDAILTTLELRNGTSTFYYWQRPSAGLNYKMYIFNYTNVEDFQNGSAKKLRVQELGPYNYKEVLARVNVEVNENHTITYQEKRSFHYVSGRPDDERVVIPNVPMMAAVAYSRDLHLLARLSLTTVLTTMRMKPFVEVAAGGFLWGYDDKLFDVGTRVMGLKNAFPYEKFGMLAFKNGVNRDRITIHSGEENLENLGMIQLINGVDKRKIWGDDECDRIFGTDGSMFPPHLVRDHNATLYVYAKDICRKIPLVYQERALVNEIPTFRYKIPHDLFTTTRTKDACYCAKTSTNAPGDVFDDRICPPAGIYNFSVCHHGFPVMVSFPHFFGGEDSLFEHIDGLNPQKHLHESYLDLHQRLGVPIGGWMRFQLNIQVQKSAGVPMSGNLPDGTILPLVWMDAGIDDLPEPITTTLYQAHFYLNALEAGFQWCSLVAVLLFFGAFLTALTREKEIEHTCVSSVESAEQTKLPE